MVQRCPSIRTNFPKIFSPKNLFRLSIVNGVLLDGHHCILDKFLKLTEIYFLIECYVRKNFVYEDSKRFFFSKKQIFFSKIHEFIS